MNRILLVIVSLFWINSTGAQTSSPKIDSLQSLLKNNRFKTPTEKLEVLSALTSEYMESDLVKAESIANEQIKLARQQSNNSFINDALENFGQLFYYQGRNDTALYCYNLAYNYYKSASDPQKKYHVLNNIGNVYKNTGKFDTAIVIYHEVLKYYEQVKNKEWESKLLANIGSLYYTSGNESKAKEYTLKAISLQQVLSDKSGLGVSLVNLMVYALNAENYKEGIKYGDEALIALKDVNKAYYASALIRTGYCYYMEGEYEKAIQYTLEAIKINEENKSKVGMMESYRTLADYYVEQKQYVKAKDIGIKALQIADTTNRFDLRHIYDLLKRVSIYLNEPENAIKYSGLQIKVIEEFLNKDWAEKISDADIKYQTEKKEKAILTLTAEKNTQKILIYSLSAVLALGGLLAYFVYRNIRSKKTIAEQDALLKEKQIIELEKDRKLLATQSVLKGEEAERSRLARDLHDGLGGLLTSVKLSLANAKGNFIITDDGVAQYDRVLGLLDTSMRELRRVAHNMMPEALVKFGIKDAVSDFCNNLGDNKRDVAIQFQFFGEETRIDSKFEIAIYRITQELVNNALKYAQATELLVQLVQEKERVHLTVQDNGKGFDTRILKTSKGAGFANITSRVESLNGNLEIYSEPDKGAEVTVEFTWQTNSEN